MPPLQRGALVRIEEPLDDAILQRMEGHHGKAAALGEQPLAGEQPLDQLPELVVDGDPQCLEAARRGVGVAGLPADALFDELCELGSRCDRLRGAGGNDRVGDAPRLALLAVGKKQIREFAFLKAVDEIGGAFALARHAHVERSLAHEGKTAIGLIELHRRNADIEHHAVDRPGRQLIEFCKSPGYEAEPTRKFGGKSIGEWFDVGVAVDADDGCPGFEQRPRIAARPEGPVDDPRALERGESRKHLGQQHRHMRRDLLALDRLGHSDTTPLRPIGTGTH